METGGSSLRHITATEFLDTSALGCKNNPPRRPFGFCFRRWHLLRCLTSKAGQNSKKKKCDGDMPCGPNVVNIRVRDDLTRSLLRLPL
jgi:hypothetical protein